MDSRSEHISRLEESIGYRFRDGSILDAALTHRSYRYEKPASGVDNQRLEFLGDAVLGFIVSDLLYRGTGGDEGELTEGRSRLTKGQTLGRVARQIGLGRCIRLGVGEIRASGHERSSTLADALEAVIGAVYLDGGITVCRRVVRRLLIPTAHTLHEGDIEHNPKGALQQACQCLWRDQPVYRVIETSGPSHAREFLVEVCLPDGSACFGKGTSRRRAEVSAAVLALTAIRDREKI